MLTREELVQDRNIKLEVFDGKFCTVFLYFLPKVCFKSIVFFKPPLKKSPIEKIRDTNTRKCSLMADFYDFSPF